MNCKTKQIIELMREYVVTKDKDWKSTEGSFMIGTTKYDWSIRKG